MMETVGGEEKPLRYFVSGFERYDKLRMKCMKVTDVRMRDGADISVFTDRHLQHCANAVLAIRDNLALLEADRTFLNV